jgi:multiple sugar transport system substrate-binding protein
MKRKALSILSSIILIGALLAGCSTNGNSGSTSQSGANGNKASNSTNNEGASGASFSGKIIIDPIGARHNNAFHEAIEVLRGMDKYKDVEISVLESTDDNIKTTPIKIAAGEQIDLIYNGNPLIQQSWADAGVIIPMDEQVKEKGLNIEETYGEYAKYAYSNEQAYGIPAGVTKWALYYNKSIFDKAGVDYPDPDVPMTWAEYRALAAKLTSGSGGDKVYGAIHLSWPMFWYGEAIMKLGGGEYFYNEEGLSNIEDPIFAHALQETYNMMYEAKSIPTYADIVTSKTEPQAFMNGKYGMFMQGTWLLNWAADKEQYPREWELGIAPMPVDEGTTPKNWGISGTFSMTPTTKNKTLALEIAVDVVRETAKLTSSEIYADQTVEQPNLFKSIADEIDDEQVTYEYLQKLFNNQETIFVSEKITGAKPTQYEELVKNEVELYFTQAQDLETTISNIKKRVDDMLKKEK